MQLHRFPSASVGVPMSPLADLTHLDGQRMNSGPTRFTTPGPAPRAATSTRQIALVSASRHAFLKQRHEARMRKMRADDE